MRIEIKELTKIFSDKTVLDSITLTLNNGIYTVCGPSGCGKTTFARIIASLEEKDRGIIEPDVYRTVFMFQEPRLFPWLDVLGNVTKVTECDEKRATELLDALELASDLHKFPYELSVGMQRRVAIARTLAVSDADLYVFDEPFAGLDEERRRIVCRLIKDNVPKDSVCLIISHEIAEVSEISDTILKFDNGKIISEIE